MPKSAKASPKKSRSSVINKKKENQIENDLVTNKKNEVDDTETKDEPVLSRAVDEDTEQENNDNNEENEENENNEDDEDNNEFDDEEGNEDDLEDDVEIDDEDKDMDEKDEEYDDEEKDDDIGDDMKCLYKYAERADSDDEDIDEEVFDDDLQEFTDIVAPEDRITKAILYPKERTRLISDRTAQLILGAKPMVKNSKHLSAKEIAELELQHNLIPLIIERPLPNGKKERWNIKELAH